MMCHAEDGTSRTDRKKNPHFIEVHTDPKAGDYVIASGATRAATPLEAGITPADLGVESIPDAQEISRRAADPFYRLEHGGKPQAAVAKARGPRITELQDAQDAAWRDDYAASQALRRAHRAERRREFTQRAADDARGIRVKLSPEDPRDAAALAAVEFDAPRRRSDAARGEKRMRLLEGPIFDGSAAKPADALRHLQTRKARRMELARAAPPARAPIGGAGGGSAMLVPRPRGDAVVPGRRLTENAPAARGRAPPAPVAAASLVDYSSDSA